MTGAAAPDPKDDPRPDASGRSAAASPITTAVAGTRSITVQVPAAQADLIQRVADRLNAGGEQASAILAALNGALLANPGDAPDALSTYLTAIIESVPLGLVVADDDLNMLVHNELMWDWIAHGDPNYPPWTNLRDATRYQARRGDYDANRLRREDFTPDQLRATPCLETILRCQDARKPGEPPTREEIEAYVEWQVMIFGDQPRPDGRHWTKPFEIKRGDTGQIIEYRTNKLPGVGWIRLYIDITERRQRETELHDAHQQLGQANKLVVDSINYARRIQTALLPETGALDGLGIEVAALWEPRDIVGGDFYWYGVVGDSVVMVLADCTGHGVPGAFMTMIAASVLDRVLYGQTSLDPAETLGTIDRLVRTLLRQDSEAGQSNDGLDAAICVYDPARRRLRYAGAMIPLLHTGDGTIEIIRGDRSSLGYRRRHPEDAPFINHAFDVPPGCAIYLASDGIVDQLSPNQLLFGRQRLLDHLNATAGQPLATQFDTLRAALAEWRGEERQIDDMTLLAFRF